MLPKECRKIETNWLTCIGEGGKCTPGSSLLCDHGTCDSCEGLTDHDDQEAMLRRHQDSEIADPTPQHIDESCDDEVCFDPEAFVKVRQGDGDEGVEDGGHVRQPVQGRIGHLHPQRSGSGCAGRTKPGQIDGGIQQDGPTNHKPCPRTHLLLFGWCMHAMHIIKG